MPFYNSLGLCSLTCKCKYFLVLFLLKVKSLKQLMSDSTILLVKFYLRLRECFVLIDHYVCCGVSVTVLCQTKIVKDSALFQPLLLNDVCVLCA